MSDDGDPPFTVAVIAKVPKDGVTAFQDHEANVLPMLPKFGGRIERRLRTRDGTAEIHILSFSSEDGYQRYSEAARTAPSATLLGLSRADVESLIVTEVKSN